MADNTIHITGMFGAGNTYFAGSPVVINVEGLDFPSTSPIKVVRVNVIYDDRTVGEFSADAGNSTSMKFDISSALRAIWSDYEYEDELKAATDAKIGNSQNNYTPTNSNHTLAMREYSLKVFTEFLNDQGVWTQTESETFTGGQCLMGSFTEMERYILASSDVSVLQGTNVRFGDASTKPVSMLEMTGKSSITSWVDVSVAGITQCFWTPVTIMGDDSVQAHPPKVMRDTEEYAEFLFVNRRGALETCSGKVKEAMNISTETSQYARTGKPAFKPSRSLMAFAGGRRRSWSMSSGYQTREWAEWWTMEFLMASRWWMWYKAEGQVRGQFVPVIVEPAKKNTVIYEKSKQQMPSVEFTVTLALEG